MTKSLLYCFLLGLLSVSESATAQDWLWAQKMGSGDPYDWVLGSTSTPDGTTYVLIEFYGTVNFGTKSYSDYSSPEAIYILAKYTPCGTLEWSTSMASIGGSDSRLEYYSMTVDNAGAVYVVGRFDGGIAFTGGARLPAAGQSLTTSGFIAKFDTSSGALKWAAMNSAFEKTHVTKEGYAFVHGDLSFTTSPVGNKDTVRLFNPSGQLVWKRKFIFMGDNSANFYRFHMTSDGSKLWILSQIDVDFDVALGDSLTHVDGYKQVLSGFNASNGEVQAFRPSDKLYNFDDWEVRGSDVYMLGTFYNNNTDSLSFDATTLKVPGGTYQNYYKGRGFLARYNWTNDRFAWADGLEVMSDSRENHMVIGPSGSIFTAVSGIVSKYDSASSSTTGSSSLLWSKHTIAYIQAYTSLSVDNQENVYLAGWGSNGGPMSFDTISINYSNQTGFLAKIGSMSCILSNEISISICAGSDYVFGNDTLTTAGTYSHRTCSSVGCDSTQTVHLAVTAFTAEVVAGDSTAGFTLTALPEGDHYEWFDCHSRLFTGDTTRTLIANPAKSYFVKVTKNSCTSMSICTVAREDTVALETGLNQNDEFSVAPNPGTGMFIVHCSQRQADATIIVYDCLGQPIRQVETMQATEVSVDLREFPSGLYILRLAGGNYARTAKLIKK